MYVLILPPLTVGLAAIALLLAVVRRWRSALAVALGMVVVNWYGQVFPVHLLTADNVETVPPAADTARALRVMTYNMHSEGPALMAHSQDSAGYPALTAFIASYAPDIFLAEEFPRRDGPATHDSVAALFPYTTRVGSGLHPVDDLYVTAFSRYPIEAWHHVDMPVDLMSDSLCRAEDFYPWVYAFVVRTPNGRVLVVHCHLKSNDYAAALRQVADDPGRTHWRDGLPEYLHNLRRGYRTRPLQAEQIRRYVCDTLQWQGPLIVAGDMNDVGGSATLCRLEQMGLSDAWWQGGLGFGFTFADKHLLLRLDHIMYSPHFALRGVQVDREAPFSDHYPLVADLIWLSATSASGGRR